MKRFTLPLLLIFILAACARSQVTTDQPTPQNATISNITPTPRDDPALLATLLPNTADNSDMTRIDEQGAVVFEVTPISLANASDVFEFDVVMNTHSIDLSMDLAALATLTTDNGVTVQAARWDAPLGGHHVEGKLIFPATKDGRSILEGANKLTLTILNVDVPSRVFEWQLN